MFALLSLFILLGSSGAPDSDYAREVKLWRLEHEKKLSAEDGWLTLAGLFWLEPGVNRVGSGADCPIKLPAGAPRELGRFTRTGECVRFEPETGVKLTVAGKPFEGGVVESDANRKPTVLAAGPIRLIVIQRGDRLGIRLKDNASPLRKNFGGLAWAPVDPSWKVKARFEASNQAPKLVMDTIIGTRESFESPGFAVFERDGRTYRLQAAREGDKLWFVFRDRTAGETTSENARELETSLPAADGSLILDFNKATNLPCAYSPYATCPIAPKQNRLDVAIIAGELLYRPMVPKQSAQPN